MIDQEKQKERLIQAEAKYKEWTKEFLNTHCEYKADMPFDMNFIIAALWLKITDTVENYINLQAENEELLKYGNQKYEDTINEFLDCLINAAAIPSCAADKFHCWHDREIAETEKRVAKEFAEKLKTEFNKYTKWDDPYCYLYEPEQQDEMFINHLSKIAASFGVEEKE